MAIAHFGFNWFLNIHFTEVTLTGAKGTMLLIQNYSSSSLYQQFITGFYTFCVLFSVVQIKYCQLATLPGNKTCHLGEWSMRWEAAPGAARTPPIQSASPTQDWDWVPRPMQPPISWTLLHKNLKVSTAFSHLWKWQFHCHLLKIAFWKTASRMMEHPQHDLICWKGLSGSSMDATLIY